MENTSNASNVSKKEGGCMSRTVNNPGEITRKEYERMRESYWRRVEPYFLKLEARRILDEMDRQREAAKSYVSEDNE